MRTSKIWRVSPRAI